MHINILQSSKGVLTSLHSGQLQLLFELGIVGFLLYFYHIISTYKIVTKRNDIYSVSVFGGVISFLCHQLFDNSLFSLTGVVMLVLVTLLKYNTKDQIKIITRSWLRS